MNARRLGCVLAALLALGATPAPVPRERVTSASGQFIVFADNPVTASSICALGERLKRSWLQLFGLPDRWRDPIVLVVVPAADAPPPRVQLIPAFPHLRYQAHIGNPRDETALANVLVTALCLELANRDLKVGGPGPLVGAQLPAWVGEGLTEMVLPNPEELLPVIARAVRTGHPATLEQVLDATVPATEPLLRRATAWVLVEGLLALPKGTTRFRELIAGAKPGLDFSASLQETCRADLPDAGAREKWWSLLLARKSAMTVAQTLSAGESAHRLHEFAQVTLRQPATGAAKTIPLGDVWRHAEEPWFAEFMAAKTTQLQVIRGQAHPLYVTAADHWLDALRWLAQDDPVRYRNAAQRAESERTRADQRARQIQHYLATIEQKLLPPGTTTPPLPDPIRHYLDQFDR